MPKILNRLETTLSYAPAPDDDATQPVKECTPKQDVFALKWAETGNKAAAYRIAYNVGDLTAPSAVWACASRVSNLPHVVKRYEDYRQRLVAETVVTVREALQWQLDIATANPNEVVYVAKRACRFCHGFEHKYQWKDADEYTAACVRAIDAKELPPLDDGDYGYTRAREPSLECPECLGAGIPEAVSNDTRGLTGKAAKLYKGLDYKNGQWVILLHDQAKAWENVCRMLGAFKDSIDLRTPADRQAATVMADNVTEQEAARVYLDLVNPV